jgi:phosphate-selective porin OprO/OprP
MKTFKLASLVAAAAAFTAGAAHADVSETKGGIKVKTDDGRFEASVGGRIMFDLYALSEDDDATLAGAPFGSNKLPTASSTYFRRIYLTLKGKAYGWSYKIEPDFAGASTNGDDTRDIAFQDVYLSHAFGPGEVIFGQIKPFRGMEELTSSNDLTMMERPFASAAGIFAGGASREFQQGVFYRGEIADFIYGAGVFDLRRDNTRATEGVGGNARIVFAPIHTDTQTLHIGVSYTEENPHNKDDTGTDQDIGTSVKYVGRRGPGLTLGLTTGGEKADTIGGEIAGAFGPATLQAEYMVQTLDQADDALGNHVDSQDIEAWYVQGSYFITGESKPYKKADGVFGSPKPKNDFGAFEVAVRYEEAKNKDSNAKCDATATKCEASLLTAGVNWYANPNVRFMFEYLKGEADYGVAKDKPDAFTARAQFSF